MRNFKIYLTICFLFLGLIVSANAQKLIYGGKPKQSTKTERIDSFAVTLPNKISVAKVQDDGEEDRQTFFEIKKDNKSLGKIDASVNASGGSLDNFFAFYGDLDKNKSAELIVVDFDSQSLGLGVNYYTINIFPDFETKGFTKPLSFNTSEFGKDGTFVYDAKANETLILLTEWGGVQIKSASKSGVDGMYFTGRYFRYKDGRLIPAADKPLLARRYLNSFQNERFRTDNSPLRPLNWLSSANTIKLKGDPVFDEKPLSSQTGVIEKYEEVVEKLKDENGGESLNVPFSQITVKLDSGERKTIVISKDYHYSDLADNPTRITVETIGILPIKMTLPEDFDPMTVFSKLEGKKVQINSYRSEIEDVKEPSYKLWFIE